MTGQVRVTGAALAQASGSLSSAGRMFQSAGNVPAGVDTGADTVSSALDRVGRALRRATSVTGERATTQGRAAAQTQHAFQNLDARLARAVS